MTINNNNIIINIFRFALQQFLMIAVLVVIWQSAAADEDEASKAERWDNFIEQLHAQYPDPSKMQPAPAVTKLLEIIEIESGRVLDIGTELGKNAIPFLQKDFKLTMLDISDRAIEITTDNIEKLGLSHNVESMHVTDLESSYNIQGTFQAVIGTYIFSFIHPKQFDNVMQDKVFARIAEGGYFAGHFFGPEHEWTKYDELSFKSQQQLYDLFETNAMTIIYIEETKRNTIISNGDEVLFHEYAIVAKK